MQLSTYESMADAVQAGYACPCGCNPSSTYRRGEEIAVDRCCCGNEFAVGPDAERHLTPKDGFRVETEARAAAWGEPIMAAWLIGASEHPSADPSDQHDHDHVHAPADDDASKASQAVDPVCGMTVEPAVAHEKGLHVRRGEVDYYFCGKGCKLEFADDPERYLDPSYFPSM